MSGLYRSELTASLRSHILLFCPTQIRVECQETRSLQQNRKLARKRLRLKIDEYLNGTQSKESLLAAKKISKKRKKKQRSKKKATGAFDDENES
jgi:protein subunit release factor A